MRQRQQEQESIFGLAAACSQAQGPRIATYNAPPPSNGPKIRMHADSSQIESILNPVRGIRDAQVRAGITPTNHSRNNITAVKEQSRLNALKKMQDQEAEAEGGSSSSGRRGGPTRKAPVGVMGPRSALGRGDQGARPVTSASASSSSRDFVSENKVVAAAAPRPLKAAAAAADSTERKGQEYLYKRDYGQVPQYLLQRKVELAMEEDAKAAAKAAALVPPGMRLLPEGERLDTLALLEQSRGEVERQLAALPIIIETPSQIRCKDQLERRLKEIEDAKKIFSRSHVLVHA